MLVVSLRGINQGFWSHLGCSRRNTTRFSCEKNLLACTRRRLVIDPILFYAVSFRGQRKLGPRPDWCPSQFNSTFQHFHKESHTDTLGYPQNDELKVKGIWVID